MAPAIEILVHVSGPSRGTDDARYRKEALGFLLQFDVAQRHTILETQTTLEGASLLVSESPTSSPAAKAAHHQSRRVHHGYHDDRSPPVQTPVFSRPTASTPLLPWTETTKRTPYLLIERTPALLLPRPRTAPTTASSTPHSHAPPRLLRRSQSDSWQTPPSVIPDSQPTPPSSGSGQPEILLSSSDPSNLKRPFASSSPSPTGPASSPSRKRPRLQLPSLPVSEDPQVEERLSTTTEFALLPCAKSLPPYSPSSRRPPLHPSPPSEQVETRLPAASTAAASSPPAPSAAKDSPTYSSPPSSNDPPQLSNQIHPPRPKTSKKSFDTHRTSSLREIAAELPLATFFKPVVATRTPAPLERGHWLVPIDSWDDTIKTKFWTFMKEFVGDNGQAGWGTWCVREFVPQEEEDDDDEPDERMMRAVLSSDHENEESNEDRQALRERKRKGQKEVVKVYCWGEVVGEIWLALFIASKRKIKGTGARWVDASGVAVVVMR